MKFHTADVGISFVTAIAMTDGLSKCIKKPFSLAFHIRLVATRVTGVARATAVLTSVKH